jgi:heme-degrading monooxygenase HmoA
MITEHALLPVLPGRELAFEAAFERAKPSIAATPGTEGFGGSHRYEEWRRLLHSFSEPFPVVEHVVPVTSVVPPAPRA